MRSMVRAMRLKPTAKNTVGGTNSWNSLITNARRRDLDMNGFLSTRGRMPETQLELINPTPKVLRYFHGRQFIFSKGRGKESSSPNRSRGTPMNHKKATPFWLIDRCNLVAVPLLSLSC